MPDKFTFEQAVLVLITIMLYAILLAELIGFTSVNQHLRAIERSSDSSIVIVLPPAQPAPAAPGDQK